LTDLEPSESTTDLFLSLTPERVLAAVEAAGLETNPVCYPLNAYENRVYEVELADRSRVVAKFYRPRRWSEEQILAEHDFLAELAAEEIPVVDYRPFPDGRTLHQIDGIHYGIMDRRGGRAPDTMSPTVVRRLGMLAGRIHNVGARHEAPSRITVSGDSFVHRNLAWLDAHGAVPARVKSDYFRVARELADLYDELALGVEILRIHGDLHLGNALDRDGTLQVLDLDDMANGPAVQDLWLLLPGRDEETLALRQTFLEAYEQFRLFDHETLRLIEPLRGLRIVSYSTWLARRWHDPAFPKAFPQFGEDGYWEGELEVLRDVLHHAEAAASGAPLGAPAAPHGEAIGDDGEPLSNADYFWDWEDDD
jgi:Ser/Thr protein kinase RdoA (MazF antagonist)